MSEGEPGYDKRILEMLALDDERAIDFLSKQYYKSLFEMVNRIVLDKVAAHDIVQDLFLNVWEKRHKLNIRPPIGNYLARAAVNRAINYQRDSENSQEVLSGNLEKFEDKVQDLPASWEIEANELADLIDQALALLPPKTRAMFLLSREDEMTYKEISKSTGLSEKAVEKRMSGALQFLSMFLKQYLKAFLLMSWSWLSHPD
jgi:RNA polymerase sigma-70 factor (ECF subfamily)